MDDVSIRKSYVESIESDTFHDDVSMPRGSTRGCHMSLEFGLFRVPCGPVKKCHVASPGDAKWHHPEDATCLR
jgi:hypothetical protein